MFPVSIRLDLRHYPDFWQDCRRKHFPWWSVCWRWVEPNVDPAAARFSILASKKVSVSAVARNLAQRRVQAVMQSAVPAVPTAPHPHAGRELQLVLQLKSQVNTLQPTQLAAAWRETISHVLAQ